MNRRQVLGTLLLAVGVLGFLWTISIHIKYAPQSVGFSQRNMGPVPMAQPPLRSNIRPIAFDRAIELAEQYVRSLGNPDLGISEVIEFELNFYFVVYEKSTHMGAFETLIDRYGGWIRLEPGPNMMWNKKYGMMSGMMGGWRGAPTGNMPINVEKAEEVAAEYLKGYIPSATTEEPDVFYGYYTLHVLRDGKIYGMLSVNGYTGQVWYHNWHGTFIAMRELR